MAGSLLADLLCGQPANKEREGQERPLLTTGHELQEVLVSKGWTFTLAAAEFEKSLIMFNRGEMLIQHEEVGQDSHWDVLTTMFNTKRENGVDLIVSCPEKASWGLVDSITLATK